MVLLKGGVLVNGRDELAGEARIAVFGTEGTELARQRRLIPLVADKQALRGAATAFVCEQKVCALPTADAAVLAEQLGRAQPLP